MSVTPDGIIFDKLLLASSVEVNAKLLKIVMAEKTIAVEVPRQQ